MTLDEAITHAEEIANYDAYGEEQCKCAEEHRQLAEWLKDYKRLLETQTCEDTISRQDAIKALKICDEDGKNCHVCPLRDEILNGAWRESNGTSCYGKLMHDAAVLLESLPSAQPERWIPCSKWLPYAEYGESDNVITTCGYRDVEDTSVRWIKILYFNGENWCYPTGETYDQKVYAWEPMPDPWKGGQDDGAD